MPPIVVGNNSVKNFVSDRHFDYDYPDGLDLDPRSQQHGKLLAMVMELATASHKKISRRYDSWRLIDQTLTAFTTPDDAELIVKEEDERKPISIVFPHSYTMMETLLTYLGSAFFREPIIEYEGGGSDDTLGAMLLTLAVQNQNTRAKAILALHTWYRDALSYGLGVLVPRWGSVRGKGCGILDNVDPYCVLPDPTVSIHKIQDGTFFGWVGSTSYINLLNGEKEETYFNVKYLKELKSSTSTLSGASSTDRDRDGVSFPKGNENDLNSIDVLTLYVKLVPSDWKLGDGEYPEIWLFEVAADSVIIRAQPLNLAHQMFPVAVIAPEFDGYGATPLSRLEILYGLQNVLDFMFNSHVANVRKAVNDSLIVDPFLINIKDVEDPRPGKIMRLRRPAWGKGVKDAVMQLQVNDVTRGNINDAQFIASWMQKVSATDDPMMGALRNSGPERLTKGEFSATRSGALSRLQRIAQVIGVQGMQDLGYFMAAHTQEFMDDEIYAKITSDWADKLYETFGVMPNGDRIRISPKDLDINFDIIPRDGTTPGANFSDSWLEVFKTAIGSPELMKELDIFRLFTWVAIGMGAKNIGDFKKNRPVNQTMMPDEGVIRQVKAGNLIPALGA